MTKDFVDYVRIIKILISNCVIRIWVKFVMRKYIGIVFDHS